MRYLAKVLCDIPAWNSLPCRPVEFLHLADPETGRYVTRVALITTDPAWRI